jgi:hypothetical protein
MRTQTTAAITLLDRNKTAVDPSIADQSITAISQASNVIKPQESRVQTTPRTISVASDENTSKTQLNSPKSQSPTHKLDSPVSPAEQKSTSHLRSIFRSPASNSYQSYSSTSSDETDSEPEPSTTSSMNLRT